MNVASTLPILGFAGTANNFSQLAADCPEPDTNGNPGAFNWIVVPDGDGRVGLSNIADGSAGALAPVLELGPEPGGEHAVNVGSGIGC
jgi:hypothetical protein